MEKKSRSPRSGKDGRSRRPPRSSSPGPSSPSMEDRSFNNTVYEILKTFVESDETRLEMEPYNSYKRRLVHQAALEFGLESVSEGEDEVRHNVLMKTGQAKVPQKDNLRQIVWNHGGREYLTQKSREGVRICLLNNGAVMEGDSAPAPQILAEKIVTTGSFKIINNKIVEFHEEDWQ